MLSAVYRPHNLRWKQYASSKSKLPFPENTDRSKHRPGNLGSSQVDGNRSRPEARFYAAERLGVLAFGRSEGANWPANFASIASMR